MQSEALGSCLCLWPFDRRLVLLLVLRTSATIGIEVVEENLPRPHGNFFDSIACLKSFCGFDIFPFKKKRITQADDGFYCRAFRYETLSYDEFHVFSGVGKNYTECLHAFGLNTWLHLNCCIQRAPNVGKRSQSWTTRKYDISLRWGVGLL